jgi:hypothetical protein
MGGTSKSSFPSPFPTDQEVCLKEIHEIGFRHDEWRTLSASLMGLLGSPSGGGPFLTACALAPGIADEPVEEHTIKVMCKAASNKGKGANDEPPAK